MKNNWFKKKGWMYLPISTMGFITSLAAIAFCMNVFWAIDRNSHSVSDTFYGVFPYFVCTLFLFNWVGGNTSKQKDV
ncbi:MAG TPA: hypothetical protein VE978_14390 [Chitinophagales bacterium]|nr:hypothetical protein [Chitinophagales bacterium]